LLIAVSENEYYSGGGEKTVARTVILSKYLTAYLNIMKKHWSGEKWYVDTHAGTGFTRELGVNIPGSALRALDHDFDRFYFYEKNTGNFETLIETLNAETEASLTKGEVEGIPMAYGQDPYVRIMNMNCNQGVKYLVRNGGRNAHWFTFVDPEKLLVERELME
jgi:three-Cys-motif partner protein